MQPDTHNQSVLDLARQKGMLRPSDLQGVDIARVVLTRLTASGQLEPDSPSSENGKRSINPALPEKP